MPGNRAARANDEFTDQGEPVPLDELLFYGRASEEVFEDVDPDDSLRSPRDDLSPSVSPELEGFDPELDDLCPVVKRPAKRGRPKGSQNQRSTEPAPPTVDSNGAPLSVYQRLSDYGLLRKITDIVLAKVAIPWHLRADAAQEVHATWATLTAKPEYQRNQLAHYAYKSGQHAALKLRRTIGAVVVIPGALFRTGRDTAFMEAIGAAVNPRDVDDYRDSRELAVEPIEDLNRGLVSSALFEKRLGALNLSAKQLRVARMALVERKGADDIAAELGTQLVYIERTLNQVTKKLLEQTLELEALDAAEGRDASSGDSPESARELSLEDFAQTLDAAAIAASDAPKTLSRAPRGRSRASGKAADRKSRKARELP